MSADAPLALQRSGGRTIMCICLARSPDKRPRFQCLSLSWKPGKLGKTLELEVVKTGRYVTMFSLPLRALVGSRGHLVGSRGQEDSGRWLCGADQGLIILNASLRILLGHNLKQELTSAPKHSSSCFHRCKHAQRFRFEVRDF